MIPTGFKLYSGIASIAILAAVVGGYTSGGDGVGPISAGYKGGVGDQVSYVILIGVAFVAIAVGILLSLFRDTDADEIAALMGSDHAPVGQRPVAASIWPLIAGAGLGAVMVGLAISPLLFGFGLVVLTIVALEWTMTAWADRATGDASANEFLRDEVMKPFEVPLLGLVAAGVFVLAVSRILLAASEIGAVVVGGVVSVLIFAVAVLITQRPKLSKNVVTGMVAVVAVGVLAGGIWGAAVGRREIEHEVEEVSEGDAAGYPATDLGSQT